MGSKRAGGGVNSEVSFTAGNPHIAIESFPLPEITIPQAVIGQRLATSVCMTHIPALTPS